MRTQTLASLLVIGLFAAPSFAQDNRPRGDERQWLSISQVHSKLEAAGYRNVEKIERERGGYEAKATDRNGERVKLYLHPQTGEIVGQGQNGSSRDKHQKYDGRTPASDRRNAVECNERRCRDDLPLPAVAIPPTGK